MMVVMGTGILRGGQGVWSHLVVDSSVVQTYNNSVHTQEESKQYEEPAGHDPLCVCVSVCVCVCVCVCVKTNTPSKGISLQKGGMGGSPYSMGGGGGGGGGERERGGVGGSPYRDGVAYNLHTEHGGAVVSQLIFIEDGLIVEEYLLLLLEPLVVNPISGLLLLQECSHH